jgi:hypothetical protein
MAQSERASCAKGHARRELGGTTWAGREEPEERGSGPPLHHVHGAHKKVELNHLFLFYTSTKAHLVYKKEREPAKRKQISTKLRWNKTKIKGAERQAPG